jgi:hypothetical protein
MTTLPTAPRAASRETQENVRLFLVVPGMHHCLGGPGRNVFDPLTRSRIGSSTGQAPDVIIAAHFPGSPPVRAPGTEDRTMPVQISGGGAVQARSEDRDPGAIDSAANWASRINDRRLLEVGLNGREAGLERRQAGADSDAGDDREDGGDC